MLLSTWLTFFLASWAISFSPGAGAISAMSSGLKYGFARGYWNTVGLILGILFQFVVVGIGLGALLATSETAFASVKFLGVAYLVYLGIQAIRHRRHAAVTHEATPPRKSRWRILGEGFVVGLTNPKSLVFFVAVLPQFVNFHAGAIPMQMMVLGVVFFAIALLSDSTWALLAGLARGWFARSPKRAERLSATGGVMLIGLGGVLAVTGNKS